MIKKKIESSSIDTPYNSQSSSIIKTARSQIGTTFIPDQIISLLTNEQNYRLEELCFRLVNQKIEVEKSINNNTPIQHQSFKNNLYKELETLLFQVAYLDNRMERNQKIESVYKWYKDKMKYYLSLASMKIKTYADKNEKIEIPKEEKEPPNINDEISALHHRTNFAKGFNLKLYKLKRIRVKKKEKQAIPRNLIPKQKPKDYYKSENYNNKIPTAKQSVTPSPNIITTNITSTAPTTNRELKSSYSYGMPQFTFSQANVESTIIAAKQRELALKRTQEEITEAINDFGTKRALFKGIKQKKYDTKEVIRYYSLLNQENIHNMKECEEEKTSVSQNIFSKQKEENDNINIHNHIIHRCKSQIITAKDKENVFSKVIIDKVRNISIDDKTKIVKSKKETNVTINLKQNHNLSRQKLLQNKSMNIDDYPSDSIMARISIDSLFKARLGYKKLDNLSNRSSCEISSININDNNKHLSAYDMNNCKLFEKLDNSVRSQSNNSINTGNNIIRDKLRNCSSDYLNLRQTMQSFQINNVINLKKSMKKSKKVNRSCLVDAFVNPSRNTFYPKYYLPITGSGLLSKPIEIETKQRKNHSILQILQ